ncbi:hypothetical protein BD408DRAFT_423848 [Parasitella parasitica]|nr:hypothetical protein BD408DRAFT_423848 [Parasitella parasitica]
MSGRASKAHEMVGSSSVEPNLVLLLSHQVCVWIVKEIPKLVRHHFLLLHHHKQQKFTLTRSLKLYYLVGQARQLRSHFHQPSTYYLCRASSQLALTRPFQPCTII